MLSPRVHAGQCRLDAAAKRCWVCVSYNATRTDGLIVPHSATLFT